MRRLEIERTFLILLFMVLASLPPQIAFASEPRCANTFISSPASHSTQDGVMLITGRAQLEGVFERYQVDFSTTGWNLWVLINSAPQAVVDGTLARWDTTLVPDGTFDLRVRTIDTSGNYCESFVAAVNVTHQASNGVRLVANSSIQTPAARTIEIQSLNGKLTVDVPQVPTLPYCTPSYLLSTIVTRSVRLCAGQLYRPFTIIGNNIAIVGDANRTAKIQSAGRSYAITVRGDDNVLNGIHVLGTTASADLGNWLCLYEQCLYQNPPIAGGVNYGGGILLEGSSNTVIDSTVQGGVIGIAVLDGRTNKILNNQITALSGWGIFGVNATNSAFIGNTLQDINRACVDPSGQAFAGGCESAGMLLMGADTNIIAYNVCARSGNCYYLNGEGGRANNFNKLYNNFCAAPSFNCFEITDAQGVEFDGNAASLMPENTSGCEIWLVRAQIISGRNNRVPQCNHRGSHLDSFYDPPK